MKKSSLLVATLLTMTSLQSFADPKCDGIENWAASVAYSSLKNEGLLTPETTLYEQTKVERLASEEIGDDLFRQVHHITFLLKTGTVEVITVNDASSEECSMSDVQLFLIDKEL